MPVNLETSTITLIVSEGDVSASATKAVVTSSEIQLITVAAQGLPGANGTLLILGEEPSGSINGSNALFSTAFTFVPEKLVVRINGLSQRPQIDFTTPTTSSFQLTSSPEINDYLAVDYERE